MSSPYATGDLDQDIFIFTGSTPVMAYSNEPSPYHCFEDTPDYMRPPVHICPFGISSCNGCTGASTDISDSDSGRSPLSSLHSTKDDDEHHPSYREPSPVWSIRSINSAAIRHPQLKEELLRLYFPAGLFETDFMYTKFVSPDILDMSGPTMDAAVDALALAHLDIAHSDPRLLQEAQRQYDLTCSNLHRDLQDPNAMNDDAVLGAVYILGVCEMFRAFCTSSTTPRTHNTGLRDLLLSRGPKSDYSKYAQLLIYNLRHISLIAAFTDRSEPALADRTWRHCAAMTDPHMTALTEILLRVPTTLQIADQLLTRPRHDPTPLARIVTDLATLERHLRAWTVDWYRTFDRQPYWPESTSRFPQFAARHNSVSSTTPTTTPATTPTANATTTPFPRALRFPTFNHATTQTWVWTALLQIKSALHHLSRRSRVTSTLLVPIIDPVACADEAGECAELCAQAVAYLTQSCFGVAGSLAAVGPLRLAGRWFGTIGDVEKEGWCRRVEGGLRVGSGLAGGNAEVGQVPVSEEAAGEAGEATALEMLDEGDGSESISGVLEVLDELDELNE